MQRLDYKKALFPSIFFINISVLWAVIENVVIILSSFDDVVDTAKDIQSTDR
jgi:hypothetical protein